MNSLRMTLHLTCGPATLRSVTRRASLKPSLNPRRGGVDFSSLPRSRDRGLVGGLMHLIVSRACTVSVSFAKPSVSSATCGLGEGRERASWQHIRSDSGCNGLRRLRGCAKVSALGEADTRWREGIDQGAIRYGVCEPAWKRSPMYRLGHSFCSRRFVGPVGPSSSGAQSRKEVRDA